MICGSKSVEQGSGSAKVSKGSDAKREATYSAAAEESQSKDTARYFKRLQNNADEEGESLKPGERATRRVSRSSTESRQMQGKQAIHSSRPQNLLGELFDALLADKVL